MCRRDRRPGDSGRDRGGSFLSLSISGSTAFALGLILALNAVLRLRFVGHVLGVDEANNYLAITTMTRGYPGTPFNQFFFYHPPLYMISAYYLNLVFPFWGEKALEVYSVLLSTLTAMAVYLLAARLYNRRSALFASLVYAVLPAALSMDTWIKTERLEALFTLLFLYFFLSRRSALAVTFLSASLLSKESRILTGGLLRIRPLEQGKATDQGPRPDPAGLGGADVVVVRLFLPGAEQVSLFSCRIPSGSGLLPGRMGVLLPGPSA
ncbi:MAG: glycosyltransferase family 39 protein [Actinomycetota bacterium]|nr:glycosyltransferase family 39 protein [Actinomycetota bacterium]